MDFNSKYSNIIKELGEIDLDLQNIPIKFFLLNILKKEGMPVPEGILFNLKPFYENLQKIFNGNCEAIRQYLKIVSSEIKFAESGKIDKDIIFHELVTIGSAEFSQFIKEFEDIFQIIYDRFKGKELILRGGDDDVDDQAGKTSSIIIKDFLLSVLEVLAGYTNQAQVLERGQHLNLILPFSSKLTNNYFYSYQLPKFETNLMISLAQVVIRKKFSGTIAVDDKFIQIEFSDKEFYHEDPLSITHTIYYSKISYTMQGLDSFAKKKIEQQKSRRNCYNLIQLAEKVKKIIRKVNPLFNKLLLEVCFDLDEENFQPIIVQVKVNYFPFNEIVNPKSSIFQIKMDPKQYLNKSNKFSYKGVVLPIEKSEDILFLEPGTIAVLRVESWKNINKFPYFPPRNRPKIILTNGGSVGMHLISQLKMYGENVARLSNFEFQPLFEIARLNQDARLRSPKKNISLTKVLVERDHRPGKFGEFNWKSFGECSHSTDEMNTTTLKRYNNDLNLGNFRDGEIHKLKTVQMKHLFPCDYLNPNAELVPFSVMISDEEGDGIRNFEGNYIRFKIYSISRLAFKALMDDQNKLKKLWIYLLEIGECLDNDWVDLKYDCYKDSINHWLDNNMPDYKTNVIKILSSPKITELRILEIDKDNFGTFTGKVLDPAKYQSLSTKNVIDLVFRSGVTYNLTVTKDSINVCNHLNTHYILRDVFKGDKTSLRASTAEGCVEFADSWNGLYEHYPRKKYLAEISDILNRLYSLKSIGIDTCFEIKYIQRWIENGNYRIANAILQDPRFEEKDILSIIDYVVLRVVDELWVLNVLMPFTVYQRCLNVLDYKKKTPDSRILYETIKRYFNYESFRFSNKHHLFQASEKWITNIIYTNKIPLHLKNLLIITPGSFNPPFDDPDLHNAIRMLCKIRETTPINHEIREEYDEGSKQILSQEILYISDQEYKKLRLTQSSTDESLSQSNQYSFRNIYCLEETFKISRLVIDLINYIENIILKIDDFDKRLQKLAVCFLEYIGFQRFEYFDIQIENTLVFCTSRKIWDINEKDEQDEQKWQSGRINSQSPFSFRRLIPDKQVAAISLEKGGLIYINSEIDQIESEFEFDVPYIIVRVLNSYGQAIGLIKIDSVLFALNTSRNYNYILKVLKPYLYALEQLSGGLSLATIDEQSISKDFKEENLLGIKKNEARLKMIDKFIWYLTSPSKHYAEALNDVMLGFMRYPFNFYQIKLFSYDPETKTVLSDRVWKEKNRVPKINTESSFWNKGMGRRLRMGEIFWEAAVHNKPVVVLNPANDRRCNTLRYSFRPAGPCIIAPLGKTRLMGFLKLDGYVTTKNDFTLAKGIIQVDHLEAVSRMEQSLYEKAKSVQGLIKIDFPRFSRITRSRLIEDTLSEYNNQTISNKIDVSPINIEDKVSFLIKELEENTVDQKILVLEVLTRIASSVISNSKIIACLVEGVGTSNSPDLLIKYFETLLAYCHVSDVSAKDKELIFNKITEFYINNINKFSNDRYLNFHVKMSILRSLTLLHPLTGISRSEWIDFFEKIVNQKDDPEIISRIIKCITYWIREVHPLQRSFGQDKFHEMIPDYEDHEAVLDELLLSQYLYREESNLVFSKRFNPEINELELDWNRISVEIQDKLLKELNKAYSKYNLNFVLKMIEDLIVNNVFNLKDKYEAWGYLSILDEIPLELTRKWASEMIEHLSEITEFHDRNILISESILTALGDIYSENKIDPFQEQLIHFKLLTGLKRKDIRYKHVTLATIGEICKNKKLSIKTKYSLADQVIESLIDPSAMIRTRAASILIYLADENLAYLVAKLQSLNSIEYQYELLEDLRYVLFTYQMNQEKVSVQPTRSIWLTEAAEKKPEQVGYKGLGLGELIKKSLSAKTIPNISEFDKILLNNIQKLEPDFHPTEYDLDFHRILPQLNARFITPEGKIIDTETFHQFIHTTGLTDIIPINLPNETNIELLRHKLENEYRSLVSYFEKARISDDIIMLLERNFSKLVYMANSQGLDFKGVSLRSASDEEDSARHSAAGRFSSYNHLNTTEEIVKYIKLVWASAWSPEARMHRFHFVGPKKPMEINMAVIMQLMVSDVSASGVVFVKRNQSSRGFDIEINAGLGLEAGTRNDDNTDFYSIKDGDIEIFKNITEQLFKIVPDLRLTKKIFLESDQRKQQKISDLNIYSIAYMFRKLTEELLKPYISRDQLIRIALTNTVIKELFGEQSGEKLTIDDSQKIISKAHNMMSSSYQLQEFIDLIEFSTSEAEKKLGIDYEFAITSNNKIVLLQQREITSDLQVDKKEMNKIKFHLRHMVILPIEPFVYGYCKGETLFINSNNAMDREKQLQESGKKIIIADHLDEKNLDRIISMHPPIGVIIEIGSKNSHIVIEAREYLQKTSVSIPVIRISNALKLFEGISEFGLLAEERQIKLHFTNDKDRNIFSQRMKDYKPKPNKKKLIPFKSFKSQEKQIIKELPNQKEDLLELTKVELILGNTVNETNYNEKLPILFYIIRDRQVYLEETFQEHIDNEAFMDYEDARELYINLVHLSHTDPKTDKVSNIKIKIINLYEKYGYNFSLDNFYKLAETLFYARLHLQEKSSKYNWKPDILRFYSVDESKRVIPCRRIFIINPEDGEIVDETPDEFKMIHIGLLPISKKIKDMYYMRGRIMDLVGDGQVTSPETRMELGFFTDELFKTRKLIYKAFQMAASHLLKIGFNPKMIVEILPRHITFTETLTKEMKLEKLASL
ncbi:Pyruvate phosphate dikinase, PEP/pyruvate-binding domain protein [Candidatus Magnetomorum sp. HK-1]|nr:Pyruvate phosphate dikinase, PEP/pyruvate-binding domain protein [Candidatus Magnetomorum sp. HK-1]